ncbi:MAG: alpha/beta hydrolase [Dehalococcoidia bacterium]
MTVEPIQVLGTETHRLHSECVGVDFEIAIIPPPPGVGPTPVVYVTDGDMAAPLAAPLVQMLMMGGEIPPVLTVAIGYPRTGAAMADFAQWGMSRTRDFSPTVDRRQMAEMDGFFGTTTAAGGAQQFFDFLTRELRPWLSGRFETTDDATYVGDSMGGLFGTWTLFHHTEAFNRYVLGSPWLCWDEAVSTGWEAEYAAGHSDLAASVYLAAGAEEHIRGPYAQEWMIATFARADTAGHTRRLGDALAARAYPSLRLTTRILPDETHFSINGALVAQGLRKVFATA